MRAVWCNSTSSVPLQRRMGARRAAGTSGVGAARGSARPAAAVADAPAGSCAVQGWRMGHRWQRKNSGREAGSTAACLGQYSSTRYMLPSCWHSPLQHRRRNGRRPLAQRFAGALTPQQAAKQGAGACKHTGAAAAQGQRPGGRQAASQARGYGQQRRAAHRRATMLSWLPSSRYI